MSPNATSSSAPGPRYEIRVLGPFQFLRDGAPIDTTGLARRVQSFLRMVATAPDHRVSRDVAVEAFWPDSDAQAGASNLRYFLHVLRRFLGADPSLVIVAANHVVLDPSCQYRVDLDDFERLAEEAPREPGALDEAMARYRGEPLPEDRYEDWAAPIRDRIQQTWRTLLVTKANHEEEAGRLSEAISCVESVVALDPVDEEAAYHLMRLLIATGRRADAVREFQRLERELREELDVAPSKEIVELIRHIRAQSDLPDATTSEVPPATEDQPHPIQVPVSYPLPAGPVMGRDTELAQICAALPSLDGDGEPTPLLLLGGEMGVGKTWLLGSAADLALRQGCLVLAGGCYEREGRLPYGPIRDALLDYIRARPDNELLSELDDVLPDLARILPEVPRFGDTDTVRPSTGDAQELRLRLFTAVTNTFLRIAVRQPLVLIVDDLHWADDSTLQLLHFLTRQLGSQHMADRVRIIGAHRTDEPNADLQEFIRAANESSLICELRLEPLTQDALRLVCTDRLQAPCSAPLSRSLYERSLGNPLFALQMLRLLEQQGRLIGTTDGEMGLMEGEAIETPPGVREVILQRLRRLDPPVQQALTIGSVLGRDVHYAPLEKLWQGKEDDLLAAMDQALGAYLVSETDLGYVFRHPMLRDSIYAAIPLHRRRALHGKCVRALETAYGSSVDGRAAELVHHLVESHVPDPERILRYARLAGDQAERTQAPNTAVEYHRLALMAAQQLGDARTELQIQETLGRLLVSLSNFEEALPTLQAVADRYRDSGNLEDEIRVMASIAITHHFRLTWDEGLERANDLKRRVEASSLASRPSAAAVTVDVSLARLLLSGEVDDPKRTRAALAASEQAITLAEQLEDRALRIRPWLMRGLAVSELRDIEGGADAFRRSLSYAEQVDDLFNAAAASHYLGMLLERQERLSEAAGEAVRAFELAERRGGIEQIMTGIGTHAVRILYMVGRWQEAEELSDRAVALAETLNVRPFLPFMQVRLSSVYLHRGEVDRAVQILEPLAENPLTERVERRQMWVISNALLAEHELLHARPIPAAQRMQRVGEVTASWLVVQTGWIWAWSLLEAGNVPEAEALARRVLDRMRTNQEPTHVPDALRVLGMALARQGRGREAEETLREAISHAESLPYPLAEGRSRCEYADLLLQGNRGDEAEAQITAALTIFRKLGAKPHVQRAERLYKREPATVSP